MKKKTTTNFCDYVTSVSHWYHNGLECVELHMLNQESVRFFTDPWKTEPAVPVGSTEREAKEIIFASLAA